MSKIGHNKPPRKIGWKSISVNKYVYEMLQQVAEKKRSLINCFKLLDGEAPQKTPSIPWVIELLVQQELYCTEKLEIQDNGRNIWEQTEKRFLRTYNSKRGFPKKNENEVA